MKRLSILVLAFAFLLVFSFGIMAEDTLWPDNAGTDPVGGAGWEIDVGTLEGWTDSNFEILEYQASGKSDVVGTGITVDGIKLQWSYPNTGIGKGGEFEEDFIQRIDYTIVAFAEIPCVLKMNVFGNDGWADGISIGGVSDIDIDKGLYDEGDPGTKSHFMLFDTNYGGVVDVDWNFVEVTAVDYATGQAPGLYIHACDLWTADMWANVPFGFAVSSTGLSDGVIDPFYIEMRYLERLGAGIVSSNSGLPPFEEEETVNGDSVDFLVQSNGAWSGDYTVDEDGQEIGQYDAGQNVHINMQFRIPVTGAPAGRYEGEVTFSTYTI